MEIRDHLAMIFACEDVADENGAINAYDIKIDPIATACGPGTVYRFKLFIVLNFTRFDRQFNAKLGVVTPAGDKILFHDFLLGKVGNKILTTHTVDIRIQDILEGVYEYHIYLDGEFLGLSKLVFHHFDDQSLLDADVLQ